MEGNEVIRAVRARANELGVTGVEYIADYCIGRMSLPPHQG